MKRRSFLKNTLIVSAVGVAATSGILGSSNVFATTITGADLSKAKSVDEIISLLVGDAKVKESDKIKIKAPEIAENGAVVPVGVTSEIEGTTEIISLIAENPIPFAARYVISEGVEAAIKSRFKMGKTTDVIALVKAGDTFYTAKTKVKVTKGGCGG